MNRSQKEQVIEELVEKFSSIDNFYFADPSNLTVSEINAFRGLCFEQGVEYKVYKNTLIAKALQRIQGDDYDAFDVALKGSTGVIFSPESNNIPAKIIKQYRKDFNEKLDLKGAWIQSEVYLGAENLDSLSKLKSKVELIGEVITLLQSPAKNVVSALQSGGGTLAGLIKTLQERGE
ncbi:MAG: 50S ribosomal protein L10 [Cytophagales bacterium]|nr:50S ribosomal protein L10 [Cytophagales bacterium]